LNLLKELDFYELKSILTATHSSTESKTKKGLQAKYYIRF